MLISKLMVSSVTNRAILIGLKRKASGVNGTWVAEMSSILWASRTTSIINLGESSFNLAFNTKVVLPPKIVFLTPRTKSFDKEIFKEGLRAGLDIINEIRAEACLWALGYKRAMAMLYDQIAPKALS